MKDKRPDLAAGRLGISPPGEPGTASRPPGMSSYGVGRLGIAAVEETASPPPSPAEPPDESRRPVPVPEETPAARPSLRPLRSRRWFVPALCAGGLVLLVAAVRLATWCFAPAGEVPQPAAASAKSPSPPAEAPAVADARTVSPAAAAALAKEEARTPPTAAGSFEPEPLSLPNEWERPAEMPLAELVEASAPPAADRPPADLNPADFAGAPATPQPPQAVGYKVAPAGIVVSAIMRGSGSPVAVINNRLVTVGQTVGQAKVTRIDEYAVELEEDGQRFLVSLSSSSHEPEKRAAVEENAPAPPKAEPRKKPAVEEPPPTPGPAKPDPKKARSRTRNADANEYLEPGAK